MSLLRSVTRQIRVLGIASTTRTFPNACAVSTSCPPRFSSMLCTPSPFRTITLEQRAPIHPIGLVFNGFTPNLYAVSHRFISCKGKARPPKKKYKLKVKASVKKRFKVNSKGLVKRAQSNKRHIATKKTRERIRRLGKPVFVSGQIRKNILKMLRK